MVEWFRTLAPYHDYGWFIALLAWSTAAILARRLLRDQAGWAWLPWAAWPGALVAVLELVSYAWPAKAAQGWVGLITEDVMLGALPAITVAGWIMTLPARLGLRVVASLAVFSAAGLRFFWPLAGSVGIAGAGLLLALLHLRVPGSHWRARLALMTSAVGLWLTSAGPLADAGLQPRRVIYFGEWSPVWSMAQAAVAVTAALGVIAPWFSVGESRREWRPLLAGCALWLVVGLGLAAAMSAGARRNYEEQAVARTQMAAALMNKTALTDLLNPDFCLTEVSARPRPSDGTLLWQARVPRLATAAGVELQQQLALIGSAGGNQAFFAFLQTPRAGWIVGVTPQGYSKNPRNRNRTSDRVSLLPETADDLLDWADKRARFLPPLLEWAGRANGVVFARAPLLTKENRILGWLSVEFPRAQWVAAQVQSRLQAFAVVGLGVGLAALAALQRLRTREREVARAAVAAAAQTDQMKTAFLAKVSHELRTPIQSVLGYGELLQGIVHDPAARRYLTAQREHGELMRRLVNDLLDISAIQAGAFRLMARPTGIVALVQQTVESLRPGAQAKGLKLAFAVESILPEWVEVDAERVRQVLINLVGNAIKFTDRGGVDVVVQAGPAAEMITVVVRDTGPGIPTAELSRLFQAFGRLEGTADKEGTGLGLALTAGLCRGMGGDVSVASLPGLGATFWAWFRAPVCSASPLIAPVEKQDGAPLAGWRVLIADDNALVRELFTACLEDAGAVCVAVNEGIAAMASDLGPLDAAVLDLAMPGCDGLGVARHLRTARGPALRIVGVSAHAGHREREAALAAGMDTFLTKPVELDKLLAALAPAPTRANQRERENELRARLREQFRRVATQDGAALAAAIAQLDYEAAERRAHGLMNSAAVVGDERLFEICARAQAAARANDAEALVKAGAECHRALLPWCSPASPTAPDLLPAQQPQR